MFEQRLLDTKKSLQKLASQSGKSLQDILKYLSQVDDRKDVSPNSKKTRMSKRLSQSFRAFMMAQNPLDLGLSLKSQDSCFRANEQSGISIETCMGFIQESILDLNKALTLVLQNVVEQMVTKKIYKIRQNFRDLILNLLNVGQIAYYIMYESGRIEFQDFSSNFITELMQQDAKYSTLQKLFKTNETQFKFVDLVDNNDLSNLFEVQSNTERNKYYGLIVNETSNQEQMKVSYCVMIKCETKRIQSLQHILVQKLINKIIEISEISASQNSIYTTSKLYTKKMLDLLQIIITQYEVKLKKSLCDYTSSNKQLCFSLSNIIKIILSKIDLNMGNQQYVFLFRKLANQFEQMQYKKIQEIRMYKKYVRQNNLVFLEFNRVGILQFISGNTDNQYLNSLTNYWEEGKPVLDHLFGKNQKLQNFVKKAVRGLRAERPLQIADNVKAKITTNGKRIQKIHIIIQNTQKQNNSEQKQSIMSDKQNTILNGNRAKSNMKTLKQLEKQNPGITKQGWLDMFIKGNNTNRSELRRDSSLSKKNNTYTQPVSSSLIAIKRQNSYHIPIQQFKVNLDDILIDDPALNLLNFNEIELDHFAIKVLDNLDYFQRLPQERQKLKNFISDLHDNYEIHSNPFHNFRHGINVMHTCYLLSTMPANFNILTVKDIFVNVFSGLCHDVGHTGFTNAFQIASMSKKAMVYNDRSPLQNYHASLTFQILRKEENNFLCHMDREEFSKFRKAVIENILYTDIKEHFPLLNSFNDLLKSGKVLGREDAPILSYMIVHSSDFAGSVKQFQICKEWSRRVNVQFTNQYNVEGQIGIPQTPFMKDLNNPIILSKAEGGFLRVIVYPLYQSLDSFYVTQGIAHKFKKNIENNIKSWQQLNKQQTQKAKLVQDATQKDKA